MTEATNQTTAANPSAAPKQQDTSGQEHLSLADKEKMALQYNYKWWELVWDKLIFAIFLAIFGSFGYWLANKSLEDRRTEDAKAVELVRADEASKLEQFRTVEVGRRLLLEKQLPELFAINSAISEVTRIYFPYARGKKAPDEQQVRKEYEAALEKAREIINRSPFLFDLDFNKDVDRYYEIYRKMGQLPIKKWGGEYPAFAEYLSNKFDDLCRSVIANKRGDPKTRERVELSDETLKTVKKDDPEDYIKAFYNAWKKKEKAAK
jgi:hypothetical protein